MRKGITPWLAYCTPRPDAPIRLFCFPYAGGGAAFYRNWSSELAPEVDVCPVQLPGRETRMREPAYEELGPLVEQASTALLPYLDRPYCFLGYSMGTLIAFELARHLDRHFQTRPSHLIACAFGAPHLPHISRLRYDLPEDEFIYELGKLEGTPQEVIECRELLDLVLPTIRADCRICDRYKFLKGELLPFPISAFGGIDDPQAGQELMQGWGDMTNSTFSLRMFPGRHFFIHESRRQFMSALESVLMGHVIVNWTVPSSPRYSGGFLARR
ncbi:MAG TPA: thioesterase domain-containing protein, partial [Rhodoferax sp.]|nr:thioesterase domain-containing protein [Rhodoferax sp.]